MVLAPKAFDWMRIQCYQIFVVFSSLTLSGDICERPAALARRKQPETVATPIAQDAAMPRFERPWPHLRRITSFAFLIDKCSLGMKNPPRYEDNSMP
jgi:hypothetical protein